MKDKFRDCCAVVSLFGHEEASLRTYLGLYALQHRGQESSGIVSSDGARFHSHKALGLVSDVFVPPVLETLPGHMAIGHNRYSTTGGTTIENVQPLIVDYRNGRLAIAHNGNIVNGGSLRKEMEAGGAVFQTTMDTEVILHLIAKSKEKTLDGMVLEALSRVEGAYSLALMTQKQVVLARDPSGFRPFSIGKVNSAVIGASESCAFDIIGGEFERDIEPGEVVTIGEPGRQSHRLSAANGETRCIFELIYFARPDSVVFGESVDRVRRTLGRTLASEAPAPCDIVMAVPDSSNSAALGYSEGTGIEFEFGLIRNHYVGRTFLHPVQESRDLGVSVKYNAVRESLKGRSVAVVDDSIVRGTTSLKLVDMIRRAGAREVHFRVASPPVTNPCYYGIDTPTWDELIAHRLSASELASSINADSLSYLSIEGLRKSVKEPNKYCYACFTGKYPCAVPAKSQADKSAR